MTRKIPVVLVTGFLGSGKTTLLRRMAEAHADWRMVFLVNEFAEADVDGETLTATGRPTHSVVGGSLFCECKAGDFLRTLRETVLDYHRQSPLDLLVIETSGTADPEAIGLLMEQHGLAENFSLRRIVTVVAPAKLTRLLGNLPVVEAQLKASDLVLINKTDTADAASIASVEASIRELNPGAEIRRTEYCHGTFSLPERLADLPRGELSTCDANPFSTAEVLWPVGRSLAEARSFLENLPESILRVKGRLTTPEGMWSVEKTVDTLEIQPASSAANTLVLIAHDDDEADLEQAVQKLRRLAPEVAAPPESGPEDPSATG